MILNFLTISEIFSNFLKDQQKNEIYKDNLENLVYLNIKTNKIVWDLEDDARMSELGDKHVAKAKKSIDLNNQKRNNLIHEIDIEIVKRLGKNSHSFDKFYIESPGMIIDRLSIIFIKLSVIQKLISMINEDDLKIEYKEKEKILLGQMKNIGVFYDMYITKFLKGDACFEIQQPVKIYNDKKIKGYIKKLKS